MKLTIEVDFQIAQPVWLRTDPDQFERMCTGLVVSPGNVKYLVSLGGEEIEVYGFELSAEPCQRKRLDLTGEGSNV